MKRNNMKIFKRVNAFILACLVIFFQCNNLGGNAFADEIENSHKERADFAKDESNFKLRPMEAETIEEQPYNIMEHDIEKVNTGVSDITLVEREQTRDGGTVPVIQPNSETESELSTSVNELWYAFVLNQTSKSTVICQFANTMDADLYIYSLGNNGALSYVGGSATDGMGLPERYQNVLSAGTYIIRVIRYQGAGSFVLDYYESTSDVNYEMNDSIVTAYSLGVNVAATGVIDNPFDYDYYKITVSNPAVIQVQFQTVNGYVLSYVGSEGDSQIMSSIGSTTYTRVEPGTYYFMVHANDNTYAYSSTATYQFAINKIANLSGVQGQNIVSIAGVQKIVFESNDSGTVSYVNGHVLNDFFYYGDFSGNNNMHIEIYDDTGEFVDFSQGISIVHYYSSTKPYAINVNNKPVIELTLKNNNGAFYEIDCHPSGSIYNMTRYDDHVTVLIDPDSGVVIDITNYNYWYQYVGGSHYINIGRNMYTWDYYDLP